MADHTRLADFDELIVRCRDEQAREHIAEAVASYRAGAFRACIVTTWIAVVYDIINKIRELAYADDAAAQAELTKLESIVKSHDIRAALSFESSVLTLAKDTFSLLTQNEFNDLARLHDDRQRCAHPSLNSVEQPYSPPAELARVHSRSAVQHLLMREPVQGKAALNRLFSDVSSEYFPTNAGKAKEALSHGPLKRPKEALVTNFTSALLSALIREDDDVFFQSRHRKAAALNATRTMHRALVEKIIASKLSELIRALPDDDFFRAIFFLASVPDTWQFLQPDVAIKVTNYIESIEIKLDPLTMGEALGVDELKAIVLRKLEDAEDAALIAIIEERPRAALVPRVIELYCASESFSTANYRAKALVTPMVRFFTSADLDKLLEKAVTNEEVTASFGFVPLIDALRAANIIPPEDFNALKATHGIE
jgi:hypothetical protein